MAIFMIVCYLFGLAAVATWWYQTQYKPGKLVDAQQNLKDAQQDLEVSKVMKQADEIRKSI